MTSSCMSFLPVPSVFSLCFWLLLLFQVCVSIFPICVCVCVYALAYGRPMKRSFHQVCEFQSQTPGSDQTPVLMISFGNFIMKQQWLRLFWIVALKAVSKALLLQFFGIIVKLYSPVCPFVQDLEFMRHQVVRLTLDSVRKLTLSWFKPCGNWTFQLLWLFWTLLLFTLYKCMWVRVWPLFTSHWKWLFN